MGEASISGLVDDGAEYVTRGDPVKRIVIGGLLVAFSVLIVPVVYIFGYYVAVLRETIAGGDAPPAFTSDTLGQRFMDGLSGVVITLGHMLPVLLVFSVTTAGIWLGVTNGSESVAVAGFLLAMLFAVVMLLYFSWVLPGALALYAKEDNMTAAFSISELWKIITSKAYLIAYGLSVVLLGVVGVGAGIVGFIPFIGFLLVGFIQFPAIVFSYRMYGKAVGDLYDSGEEVSDGDGSDDAGGEWGDDASGDSSAGWSDSNQ